MMKHLINLTFVLIMTSCAVFWDKKITQFHMGSTSKIQDINLVFISTYFGKYQTYVYNISEVYIDKEWKIPGGQSAIWNAEWYVNTVKDSLENTNMFKKLNVVYAPSDDPTAYTLEFNQIANCYDGRRFNPLKLLWALGTIASYGVIPYWRDENIKIQVTLYKGKEKIKSYKITEEYRDYVSVFLIPLTPFYFPKKKMMDMVMRSLKVQHLKFSILKKK